MIISIFLELILGRVQIVIEKTISSIFYRMAASTNIIIYLYSEIQTVVHLLTQTRFIFITMHSFVFSYISQIQVSATFL